MQPKKSKYLKVHKNVQAKKKGIREQLAYGQYGLKALKAGYIPAKTLETIKQTLVRKLKRTGKLWIRVFPHIQRTKKPAEVRMGKGKGSVAFWEAQVDAGQIILELSTSKEIAQEALALVYAKSPIPLLFVEKEEKTFQ